MPINNYTDAGFNQYLAREFQDADVAKRSLLSEDEFNTVVEGVSGSKITSGIIRSKAGDLILNLDKSLLDMVEGIDKVVQIGKFDDGTKGIKIKGGRGTTVSLDQLELVMGATVVSGVVNTARLYVDNGGSGGKNRLLVQFFRGSPKVLAQES